MQNRESGANRMLNRESGADRMLNRESGADRMPNREKLLIPPMRPDERGLSALSHLSTIVPLWALVGNAVLYFLYRQSSRVVCFHARQGINFQLLFLVCVIPLIFLYYLVPPLVRALLGSDSALALQVCDVIRLVADWGIGLTAAAYAACCLIGIFQALRGRIFVYPLAGKQVYRQFLRHVRIQDPAPKE